MPDVSAAFLRFNDDNDDVKANVISSYLSLTIRYVSKRPLP